ncbi:lipocalin family protein [Algoriphagus halophytocola]|uniref:Lipocalin family protein n=1 Tax=Algoriphagus halophytocola TaxID=2991499 RepID=A0ABY6MGS7_9BACT|nr:MULTISPECIES: lipocalin family protein [unclassified Algoriphagus]UZD22393.1 lipocalin family protein [Algoriphagus sp. TR-M5]WBL43652.1 lipocalin family protein [Algoriphagus sp. TR-M9]
MKSRLLPLIALAIFIYSCKDVVEPSPDSRIVGVYELSYEGNAGWGGDIFRFVDLMQFNSDGTVTGENYTTEVDSDEVLGYRGHFTGTFTIVEGVVTISYDEMYYMNMMDVNYIPKEDLILYEGAEYFPEYSIVEDYSELIPICSPNAICTGTLSYFRAD